MSDSQKWFGTCEHVLHKNKKKKTHQCRNELTKLKYPVVKGIIAKFLLYLDAFKFLWPALTIIFVLNKFCHVMFKALKWGK